MIQPVDATLQHELERLYSRYAQVLDDGPLDAWPDLFTDECLYRVMPRDNHDQGLPLAIIRCESRGMLADRVRAVRETIMHEPRYLRHQISNVLATLDPATGVIESTANYLVVEVLFDELPRMLSVGRYIDRVVRAADGMLRFQEKLCVYDSVLVPNTIVYPI
ncbi:MAG: aromatic-ring-hydroxylating dioxygenase subunit beta [Pseudomonadales bacterium]|nr:aromatic-ring-hydroxylating dioxygenase subunit beta [Pseudomonadales bacterium]